MSSVFFTEPSTSTVCADRDAAANRFPARLWPSGSTSSRLATAPRADRARRHGRHLPRDRLGARPRRRDQGPRRALRAGRVAVRERFTREALAAARLSGEPNTVTIFDVGEHDGRPLHRHGAPRAAARSTTCSGARARSRPSASSRGSRRPRARSTRRTRGRRSPRRQAGEPDARRRRPRPRRRLRDRERGRHGLADDDRARCSAPPAISRPSRRRASAPSRRATATRSASSRGSF